MSKKMNKKMNKPNETETVTLTRSDLDSIVRKITDEHGIKSWIHDSAYGPDPTETALSVLSESSDFITFFDVHLDIDNCTLTFPRNIDPDHIDNVVGCYLELLETDIHIDEKLNVAANDELKTKYTPETIRLARKYDDYTKPTRGADDGTYDYAGSFISVLVEILKTWKIHETTVITDDGDTDWSRAEYPGLIDGKTYHFYRRTVDNVNWFVFSELELTDERILNLIND
jgi:hypothetical protein